MYQQETPYWFELSRFCRIKQSRAFCQPAQNSSAWADDKKTSFFSHSERAGWEKGCVLPNGQWESGMGYYGACCSLRCVRAAS
jgi:hypothetical protein